MTNFEKIFGKTRDELLISDVEDFFSTAQEETSLIEFKEGRASIESICQEIAAFANTQGGLLFIGAPTENKEGNNKYCQGKLTFSKIANSKTSLMQKISTRIVPSPMGIEVFHYQSDEGNIFVVDIPQSTIPPHQCSHDGKYYIRLEEESKFAPHGLIQAMFMKRRLPDLKAEVEVETFDEYVDIVSVTISNSSNIPAEKVHYAVDTFNLRYIESQHMYFTVDWMGQKKHHYYTSKLDGVLASRITYSLFFRASHKLESYAIRVGLWCRDLDYQEFIYVYFPDEKKLVFHSEFEIADLVSKQD